MSKFSLNPPTVGRAMVVLIAFAAAAIIENPDTIIGLDIMFVVFLCGGVYSLLAPRIIALATILFGLFGALCSIIQAGGPVTPILPLDQLPFSGTLDSSTTSLFSIFGMEARQLVVNAGTVAYEGFMILVFVRAVEANRHWSKTMLGKLGSERVFFFYLIAGPLCGLAVVWYYAETGGLAGTILVAGVLISSLFSFIDSDLYVVTGVAQLALCVGLQLAEQEGVFARNQAIVAYLANYKIVSIDAVCNQIGIVAAVLLMCGIVGQLRRVFTMQRVNYGQE